MGPVCPPVWRGLLRNHEKKLNTFHHMCITTLTLSPTNVFPVLVGITFFHVTAANQRQDSVCVCVCVYVRVCNHLEV